MTMEQFFTAEAAEQGIELPLYLPNGEKTEYFLRVRGIDSDIFRIAEAKSKRDVMTIVSIDDEEKKTKALIDIRIKLAATLVVSWNLPEKCTPANVEKLFRNAPQLLEMVDLIASRRALFFSNKSKDFASGSKRNSSSTKSRKNRGQASAIT